MAVFFIISVLIFVSRITRPSECANRQAVFYRKEQTYLANHAIETKQAKTEMECGMQCVANELCASVNYKTSGIGKGRCELNRKKLQAISDANKSLYEPEFNHLYIVKKEPAPAPTKQSQLFEGYRLETKLIKTVRAASGQDCILECKLQDESCRSANFRKSSPTCEGKENCELLKTVASEESAKKFKKYKNFDHYKLLYPLRKPEDAVPSNISSLLEVEISASLCEVGEAGFGMESGRIQDSQIIASSSYNANYTTKNGRLNSVRSWSAKHNDSNQWIQVDLGREGVVTAIGTQGRRNYTQWVKTYSVSFSCNGSSFEPYKIDGVIKVFSGNNDRDSIATNTFSPSITARYIRIHPLSWYGWVSMRFEVYGCYRARSCLDYYESGNRSDDIYYIYPAGYGNFPVKCDMNGGGWTVFQHRFDGSVNFYLGWTEYKKGFGNISGEFWLGLEKLHRITTSRKYKLRIELEDFHGNKKFAEYSFFEVGNENDGFRLSIGAYSGNAGDSLQVHNNMKFTTKDVDHDLNTYNCAQQFKGAWWYNKCHSSNLNGLYHSGGHHSSEADGINWYDWRGYHYSMKTVTMKIKEL